MKKNDVDEFLLPRQCLRNPIPEIFEAAVLLDQAVSHYLEGKHSEAKKLIRQTDDDWDKIKSVEHGKYVERGKYGPIRAFTESLWGKKKRNPDQWKYLRKRYVPGLPELSKRESRRTPSFKVQKAIVDRWGRHCTYCGVPLIHKYVPETLQECYPDLRIWRREKKPGNPSNHEQHAAFQLMWMQFEHVEPHSRSGSNDSDNVVVSCAPCNYGKGKYTLEELGLLDPRPRPVVWTSWDGLERMLPIPQRLDLRWTESPAQR